MNSTKPRAIIVKFSFYQDKEYIWSFVRNLKDSGIGIANDFPREIDKIHEKLYPVLKSAKKAKQKAYFKVDKLIINGQVYRGEETKYLAHYGLIMNSTWTYGGASATRHAKWVTLCVYLYIYYLYSIYRYHLSSLTLIIMIISLVYVLV